MTTNTFDGDAQRRAELGALLKVRRALLQPEDVGLPRGIGRRNTAGLRREEVAQISGVGITWYTWLEQGRKITVSEHVVDALARALRLDQQSHRHLRRLAGLLVPDSDPATEEVPPQLGRLLDSVMPTPASIFGPAFDYVAWNEAHARLWRVGEQEMAHRNVIWLALMSPHVRRMVINRETLIAHVLAHFRFAVGQHPGEPRFRELIEALQAQSEEFRTFWAEFAVGESMAGPLTLDHPRLGLVHLDVAELRVCATPSLTLTIQVPIDPIDRRKLQILLAQ